MLAFTALLSLASMVSANSAITLGVQDPAPVGWANSTSTPANSTVTQTHTSLVTITSCDEECTTYVSTVCEECTTTVPCEDECTTPAPAPAPAATTTCEECSTLVTSCVDCRPTPAPASIQPQVAGAAHVTLAAGAFAIAGALLL